MPSATFIKADIMAMDFPATTFDAVVSFYTILHIPREEHRTLVELSLASTWWLAVGEPGSRGPAR